MANNEQQQMVDEAKELAEQLVTFAAEHGWVKSKPVKANKKFAFVTLTRDYDDFDGPMREEVRAFYAIDSETDDDQVTHVDAEGVTTVLDPDSGGVREVIERQVTSNPEPAADEPDDGGPSAAHQPPVPPTSPAGAAHPAAVPPIDDVDDEPAEAGAAHSDPVPPTGERSAAHSRTVVEDFGIVPEADGEVVAEEAKAHMAAAAEAAVDGEHPVVSQQDTYAAVRHQQVNPTRNWSKVASVMKSKDILTRLGVNRQSNNKVEITWQNSLSNSIDRAVVAGDAKRYPPHITPEDFDPEAHGEDLRILHFLEVGGGFRSVAVARIKKIG